MNPAFDHLQWRIRTGDAYAHSMRSESKSSAVKIAKVCSFADVLHKLGDIGQLVITCIERRIDGLN